MFIANFFAKFVPIGKEGTDVGSTDSHRGILRGTNRLDGPQVVYLDLTAIAGKARR